MNENLQTRVKRTEELKIRFTKAELAAVRQRAQSLNLGMADLVRMVLAEKAVDVKPSNRIRSRSVRRRSAQIVDPDFIREVAKIGNNLTQISLWANTYKNHADAIEIMCALSAIDQNIQKIYLTYCPEQSEE